MNETIRRYFLPFTRSLKKITPLQWAVTLGLAFSLAVIGRWYFTTYQWSKERSLPLVYFDNGLAKTPPMGWNGWNYLRCDKNFNEQTVRETADALVDTGMKDLGYEYVVLDDCWQKSRDENGDIIVETKRFPNGIKALSDYVHSKGLKFGIYTCAGRHTCEGRPGSYEYEEQDIKMYESWNVDYIKIDWCDTEGLDPIKQYAKWRELLLKSKRPMVMSLAHWGINDAAKWGPYTGNMWRTTPDILDNWEDILKIIDKNEPLAEYASPGRWNDPDMLQVGNRDMTTEEDRSHFSMWAIMAAPLMAGNELRTMTPATKEILTNAEVIAVDQDPLGIQGRKVFADYGKSVWVKPLQGTGERAVVLFNRQAITDPITVPWSMIGLANGPADVRDLWAHQDLGAHVDAFTAHVPPHGIVMVKIKGKEGEPLSFLTPPPSPTPLKSGYLSDQEWSYGVNGWGPVEKDTSNGESEPEDGRTITLPPNKYYEKGLGVHAYSDIRYNLNGQCKWFTADIGIDTETGKLGSATFKVFTDSQKVYDSGEMKAKQRPKKVRVNLKNKKELQLYVSSSSDSTEGNHADWADAKVECNQ